MAKRYPMAGPRLVKLMERYGVTSDELARRLGISTHTVAKWRQDRRQPCCRHMDLAIKLAIVAGDTDALQALAREVAA